jgi:hypothetical protein
MANRNTQGFGLVPAGTLGQTPATSGQGKYKIDGQTTDAPILGVLNGIFFNAATTLKPTFQNHYVQVTPANSEDIDAFVFDNPQQQYVVATDDSLAQSGYLETYDMNASAGSTTTGKSSSTLDIGDTSADAASFRLLRSAEDPENDENAAFRSVIVVPNLIELQS